MLRGRRIALVEDDEIMGASIAQRLRLEGAEVVWLKQAVRALGAIRTPRGALDAVVRDIRLPDGTGEEVFRALCQTSAPPPFPSRRVAHDAVGEDAETRPVSTGTASGYPNAG